LAPGFGPGPAIYGPNPVNGTWMECSGWGTYQPNINACVCFAGANATEEYTYAAEIYTLDRTNPGHYVFPTIVNVTVPTCGNGTA